MRTLFAFAIAFLVIGNCAHHSTSKADDTPTKAEKAAAAPTQAELDKQFAERMSGVQLVGHYTLWGKEDSPAKDTYTIEKVTKLDGDKWQFVARIQYAEHDRKIAMALPVKWAGDTPVISLDKLLIPGFGTFSARVVFHGDQYAAVWDGGDHGGHMYGKVVKMKDQPASDPKSGEK